MTQIAHRFPTIDKAIWNKAGDLDKPIANAKRARRGAVRGETRSTKIPDEIVLEIRRLHEIERWALKRLLGAFPQYSRTWICRVLGYELRANLRVKP